MSHYNQEQNQGMQYDLKKHNITQTSQKIRIVFYVMQQNHKNIFLFSNLCFRIFFEKLRSLFKVMVTIEIINKISFNNDKFFF